MRFFFLSLRQLRAWLSHTGSQCTEQVLNNREILALCPSEGKRISSSLAESRIRHII